MTKQEEIREGVAVKLCNHDGFDWEWLKEQPHYKGSKDCEFYFRCADDILTYEDSQGVVIKVDRKLPENPHFNREDISDSGLGEMNGFDQAILMCKKAGYVAVEPLIKE